VLTFLLGGARSGKSTLAVRLGQRQPGPVTYVATAPRIDGDHDLDARIAAHRAERPSHWWTVEAPIELVEAVASRTDAEELVIVDCLTLWVNNLLWRGDDEAAVDRNATAFAAAAAERSGPTVVISNEVGLGVHPETAVGRVYRDALGRTNQRVAERADRSLLLVAGRALPLVDPMELLP
jgi:adenosyl cobinamide kinase/adenosyl cobinamide phosphate guanylyltransferase